MWLLIVISDYSFIVRSLERTYFFIQTFANFSYIKGLFLEIILISGFFWFIFLVFLLITVFYWLVFLLSASLWSILRIFRGIKIIIYEVVVNCIKILLIIFHISYKIFDLLGLYFLDIYHRKLIINIIILFRRHFWFRVFKTLNINLTILLGDFISDSLLHDQLRLI